MLAAASPKVREGAGALSRSVALPFTTAAILLSGSGSVFVSGAGSAFGAEGFGSNAGAGALAAPDVPALENPDFGEISSALPVFSSGSVFRTVFSKDAAGEGLALDETATGGSGTGVDSLEVSGCAIEAEIDAAVWVCEL